MPLNHSQGNGQTDNSCLFPKSRHWGTPHNGGWSKHHAWAKKHAEAVADNGEVRLFIHDNWWTLQCQVRGINFKTSSTSLRKCVSTLVAFTTRGCQYVETPDLPPAPRRATQELMF